MVQANKKNPLKQNKQIPNQPIHFYEFVQVKFVFLDFLEDDAIASP